MAIAETIVRPTVPLVPETIELSLFDQYNGRHYTPLLFVFKLPDPKHFEAIVSDLREGLARLLDEIPFLAGNVITDDNPRDYLTLDIPEDGGAIFKVKRLVDENAGPVLDFEELERDKFPASAFKSWEVCPTSFVPDAVSPCLQVQVNLIRGGIIVAAYLHHAIVDGEGFTIIYNRWAKHVAAVSEGRFLPTSELLPPEAFDRSALLPEKSSKIRLCDFPSFQDGRGMSTDITSWWNVGHRMQMNGGDQAGGIKVTSWYITKENIRKIEEKAIPKDPKANKVTAGNVLSAFIFRHYTRARRLEQQGYEKASFHNPCNIRSRIEPALHPKYLGNSIVPSRTRLPISEIVSTDADSLYRIASAINSNVDWWSSDNIWELLGAMDSWPRARDIERTMDLNYKTDLHLTNLSGFTMFDSYWGSNLGNLSVLKYPAISLMDGFGIIMPRTADGGQELILLIDDESLEVLKEDKEFTDLVHFVCV